MVDPTHPTPAQDEPARPDDAVEVGRIIGAWGVKGGVSQPPDQAAAGAAGATWALAASTTRRLTVGDIWAPTPVQ